MLPAAAAVQAGFMRRLCATRGLSLLERFCMLVSTAGHLVRFVEHVSELKPASCLKVQAKATLNSLEATTDAVVRRNAGVRAESQRMGPYLYFGHPGLHSAFDRHRGSEVKVLALAGGHARHRLVPPPKLQGRTVVKELEHVLLHARGVARPQDRQQFVLQVDQARNSVSLLYADRQLCDMRSI